MPQRQLTGARIRARRMDKAMRQADLAHAAGISPSYLNLIEHNRRRIAGRVLQAIARALDVDPSVLADGAEAGLLQQLRLAASEAAHATGDPAATMAEVDLTEDFAGRFPGWAALVAAQAQRLARLHGEVAALTDRLAHDPRLATSLHEVLSAATSIRSTSSILVGTEVVDRDWQARFHANIYQDSQRLAEASRLLVGFLEAPGDAGQRPLSPAEEVDAWLVRHGWQGAAGADTVAEIATLSPLARPMAQAWIARFAALAVAMPDPDFATSALAAGHDPAVLAARYGRPMTDVMIRLAMVPETDGHPATGIAVCDGAGVLTLFKPVAGFALPRVGAACPYWPLYQVLSMPGQPLRRAVALPGSMPQRFACYAMADRNPAPRFDRPPTIEAVMLVVPQSGPMTGDPEPVGPGCRVCPRDACDARREPSVLT